MRVLGLATTGHGSSICLVEDGRITCAVNLERITRQKFSLAALPRSRARIGSVLVRTFQYEKAPPILNFYEVFPEMLEYVTGERDLSKAGIDLVVKTHDSIKPNESKPEVQAEYEEFLRYMHGSGTALFPDLEHHLCHAYQAYLSSPFEEAAILTIDGTGERLERLGGQSLSATLCAGAEDKVTVLDEVDSLSSVGGFYSSVTRHLGFREEQEGNTMALAAFGTDRMYPQFQDTFDLAPSGTFRFRLRSDAKGLIWMDRMRAACPQRAGGGPIEDEHKDLAWACQAITETILINAARGLHERTGQRRLAMAGGVTLNCVANAKILAETPIDELYVMPNAGDRGLAAGAALFGYHVILGGTERHPPENDYLGRSYDEQQMLSALQADAGVEYRRCDDIGAECAELIAGRKILGWLQGGCEFGPRALGHRSIVGDPRTLETKERLDREIKRREWFRPYAPSVLEEHANDYFEMRGPSPYMLQAVRTRPLGRSRVPGVVHVDGTARVQTVPRDGDPKFRRLISRFFELTSIPMVLNTSFNGYGEPMVETPADALSALHLMQLDAIAVGDYLAWPSGKHP